MPCSKEMDEGIIRRRDKKQHDRLNNDRTEVEIIGERKQRFLWSEHRLLLSGVLCKVQVKLKHKNWKSKTGMAK